MKLKVLVAGAPFAHSGYSTHCRTILNSLKQIENKIDLYLLPYRWSTASDTYEDPSNPELVKWYKYLAEKFNPNLLGFFDISIQIGVPTEWKNMARYNVGVTAGIETQSIPQEWIAPMNSMNKIITISQYARNGIVNTVIENNRVTVSVDVVEYPIKKVNPVNLIFPIDTTFNFLHVGQWAPRKNIENMVKWFVEEFHDNLDVGLILKVHHKSNSTPDRYEIRRKVYDIVHQYKDRKCKLYLFHGDMTDEEINALYMKANAYISAAHGEGWGLGIFEAAYSGVPVIAPDYSGYKEFLYAEKEEKNGKKKLRPFFQKVNYELKPLEPQHFAPGLLLPGMYWAYPMATDFKRCIRDVYKDYGRFKKQAQELKTQICNKFTDEYVANKYINAIFANFDLNIQEEVIEVV